MSLLKIDKSFITNMLSNDRDMGIVKMSIMLAHELGLEVIAEGVETKEQLEFLKKEGCDTIQGFYLSIPAAITDIKFRK